MSHSENTLPLCYVYDLKGQVATPKHQQRQTGWPERSGNHSPNKQWGKEKQRNSSNNFIYPLILTMGNPGSMSSCHIRFILTLNKNVT